MEDDEEKTDESGDSTRATSMESKIDTIYLQSSHSKKQSMTQGFLSPINVPTASPLDWPTFLNVLSPRDPVEQTTRGGDRDREAKQTDSPDPQGGRGG